MTIIGDRHYKAAAGETLTFRLGTTAQIGSVASSVNNGPGGPLPVTVLGGGHGKVVVTAGFTGATSGSVEILVAGSAGGSDTSRLRQLTGLPFRTAIFVID